MRASVLFVCLGNICRSPTAHGVLEAMVRSAGLQDSIDVDSCGTGAWHAGEAPARRATLAAAVRGYDLSPLRARQVTADDFHRFDYILAMDSSNLSDLKAMCPDHLQQKIGLFLDFGDSSETEVPDPYYGGDDGFEHVLDLVENASRALLKEVSRAG